MRKRLQRKYHDVNGEEGFTLFLVAVLLVLAAMIAATVMQQSHRDEVWNPKVETQKKMQRIAEVLIAYQRTYKKLPCVSSLTTAESVAADGVSQSCAGAGVAIGAVPYKTLQLSAEASRDSWGNKILFAVTKPLTDVALFPAGSGSIQINDASGTVASDAAFVLVSHGPDSKGAYRGRSGAQAFTCASQAGLDQENCDNDVQFTKIPLAAGMGAAHFDDQVEWRRVDAAAQSM